MNSFIFFLGTTHELSLQELQSVLSRKNISLKRNNHMYALCDADVDELSPKNLIQTLGGTVKIAQKITDSTDNAPEEIAKVLTMQEKRVVFAVHAQGRENFRGKIKSILREEGKSARFVHVKNRLETAYHQNKDFFEFFVISDEGYEGVYQVVAAQDIQNWSKRDFDRPRSDPKSGMLPPKVARMMVNIAISDQNKATIYDPFCGSGTILSEALMLGHKVVGSDMSQKAVDDSIVNVEWLKKQYNLENSSLIFQKDVAHVKKEDLNGQKIDAVVYEPYMGPSRIREEKVKDIIRGLKKLYIGALRNIGKVIEKGTVVVAIFPEIKVGNVVKSTASLIDRCENFGYTRRGGPISYSRPNSIVVRKIYILEKI